MQNYMIKRSLAYYAAVNYYEEEFVALLCIMSALKKKRKSPHKLYKLRSYEGSFNILIDRHLLDDDTKFKEYFRVSPNLFSRILNEIIHDVEGTATTWVKKPISAHEKLCITLRYLATGETFRSLAFQFRAHHTTIGRIVSKCLTAIINHFLHAAMPTPTSQLHRRNIEVFFNRWNFPNCCGAIDGKHIRIKCPANAGSAYFNYKDYHSMVLLAIVDGHYKFTAVDVGSYGREGDAGRISILILFNSNFINSNFKFKFDRNFHEKCDGQADK